jgi:cytochrome P450
VSWPAGSPEAIGEFAAAFCELIEARRADPRDDLVSAWIHGTVDGEPLDTPEIIQDLGPDRLGRPSLAPQL